MKEKLFEEIYKLNKSHVLREAKDSAEELEPGVFAWFQRNKRDKEFFDLVIEKKRNKHKITVEEYAWYEEGYSQSWGSPTKRQYFLRTQDDYSAGNGGGVNSKRIPIIEYERHLDKSIKRADFFIDFMNS